MIEGGNMMKEYSTPLVMFEMISGEDVITTSGSFSEDLPVHWIRE